MATTIAAALSQARCLETHCTSWRLDGELLLADALGRQREWLLAHAEECIDATPLGQYQGNLQRRRDGEPLAYILGCKAFWDFELKVTPDVLIPRPETELLVETTLALTRARAGEALCIADLGTGSGAIAIALARHNPHWRVEAIDVSAAALDVARVNAERLGVTNIEFIEASWCDGLRHSGYDAIVSNPPYVAAGDGHLQLDGLAFEPDLALLAGADGMGALSTIIEQSVAFLKKDSWLLLEHGFDQRDKLEEKLRAGPFGNIQSHKDYAGHDRVIAGQRQ